MKKYFTLIKAIIVAFIAAAIETVAPRREFAPRVMGYRLKQGGFVTLLNNYQGYAAGTVVELPASTEAALIASNQATASAGPPTPGNVTTTATSGAAAIATGAASVTITNPLITSQTKVYAMVAQAAADATLLRVERVVCVAGSVTIFGTANATAPVTVDWSILNGAGTLSQPQ